MNNPLLSVDSYKLSHYKQYPPNTNHIYSYIEARSGTDEIVVYGINEFIQQINQGLTYGNVSDLEVLAKDHGVPFNTGGWEALLEKYQYTHQFPLLIRGVLEGSVVKVGTPVLTIVNTDPEFPWLTSFFETLALRCVWYPSTVATISRECKKVIAKGLMETGDPMTIDFKLHDFGARGASSGETAAFGGAGHLINFLGTDNIEAVRYVSENHTCSSIPGLSIPATEHSTVTSWGRSHEKDMYEAFIVNNLGEGKIAACVSDSYNIWEALEMWKSLEPLILKTGGTLVIRPDSGDPVETPVAVVDHLLKLFGYTLNSKGYKVLPDHIRVIQGDGIDKVSIGEIIGKLTDLGISTDNIAFGMGGGLLQHCDRDTYGWAMKCSAAHVDGEWIDVYKDPIAGGKTSKRGLVYSEGVLENSKVFYNTPVSLATTNWRTYYDGESDYARPSDSWDTIKQRAEV